MWLGWDHCGYNSIDDEPLDPDNTMEWQPAPSGGRGERAHLLGPVSLPREVRDRNRRVQEQRDQPDQERHPQRRNASVNRTAEGGAAHVDEESEGRRRWLSAEGVFAGSSADGGSRRTSGSRGGGAGGAISSFFRGGSRGVGGNSHGSSNSSNNNHHHNNNNNSSNNNNNGFKKSGKVYRRTRFLSEDNSTSGGKSRHHQHFHHHQRQQQQQREQQRQHGFHATAPAACSSPPPPGDDGDSPLVPSSSSSSRWQRWRWGRRTSSFDGALPRRASDNSWRSSGSYGRGGGGAGGGALVFDSNGDGGGGGIGTPGKISEMFRPAFFDPDYDTSRHHLVKLFDALDTNRSGTITYEAMRMGLANLGTYSDVNYLMRRAEMDKTKEISLDDFVAIVQDYAEKMFAAKQEVPVSCFCYDYSPEGVAFRWVKTGNPNPPSPSVSLRELMSEEDHQKGGVRWLCVTGSDPSLVIHMANRFGIHPLQVEDCLNPRERLKVDAFRAAPVKASKVQPTPQKVPSRTSGDKEGAARADVAGAPTAPAPAPTAAEEAAAASAPATAAEAGGAAAATARSKWGERAAAGAESAAAAEESGGGLSSSARSAAAAATPPATTAAATSVAGAPEVAAGAAAAAGGRPGASADAARSAERSPAATRATATARITTTPEAHEAETERASPGLAASKTPPPPHDAEPGGQGIGAAGVGSGAGSAVCGGGGGTDISVPAAAEEILHVVLGRISLRNPTVGRPSNFEREQVSIFLIGNHTVLFIEPTPSGVSDQISNRIYYAGSKLRLNNARYMVYSLMDSIVDDVFPIMQHFQAWLVQLQEQLHSEDSGPSLDIVRAIQQISRDMHMITFYLRPMKVVATQLITDLPGNDADLKRHLEDLRDHLLMLEEQALRMSTWSRSLNKDWVNEQQHRMNQVVYILTMVTSAFMPAQFLTGVFGMNFKFMPELNWRYSYASFWVLVALLAFSSYTVYKRHKWL